MYAASVSISSVRHRDNLASNWLLRDTCSALHEKFVRLSNTTTDHGVMLRPPGIRDLGIYKPDKKAASLTCWMVI